MSQPPVSRSPRPPTDDSQDPLDELAEQFAQQCRLGASPDIESIAAMYPELASEIRDLFPLIATLEADKKRSQSRTPRRLDLGSERPERLGDFVITREIGRGGMGIVYEATQETLKRRVAIKVLPPLGNMPDNATARFLREAQMAARLHHAHIVPVFGIGHDQGFHYIVMQLIQGEGLDQWFRDRRRQTTRQAAYLRTRAGTSGTLSAVSIDELPPPPPAHSASRMAPERLARIGVQAADALQYAHDQGVLHRDIKPANLLLEPSGHLWISDFGLAKAVHQESISRSSDLVGTLMYMAPERFRGECDMRADVYSLGLTLAELALGRALFGGQETGALLQQILQGVGHQRGDLDFELPYDLEIILLKALARDPAMRYASARDLAWDLRAFIEQRPIQARPPAPVERAWRWARRNPTIAGLSATSIGLLLLTTATTSWGYVQQSRMRTRTEAMLDTTLNALDSVYRNFAGTPATEVFDTDSATHEGSVLSDESAEMLGGLMETYEELAKQGETSQRLLMESAIAQQRVGEIQLRLGKFDLARQATAAAIVRMGQLPVERLPNADDWLIRQADCWNQLATAQASSAEMVDMAASSRANALSILRDLAKRDPMRREVSLRRAGTLLQLARNAAPLALESIRWMPFPLPDREGPHSPPGPQGPRGFEPPRGEGPPGRFGPSGFQPPRHDRGPPGEGPHPAPSWVWLTPFDASPVMADDAETYLKEAVELLQQQLTRNGKDLAARGLLARALAQQARQASETRQSEAHYVAARQAFLELFDTDQVQPQWELDFAFAVLARTDELEQHRLQPWLDTEKDLMLAIRRLEARVDQQPLVPDYSLLLAILHERAALLNLMILRAGMPIPEKEVLQLAHEHLSSGLSHLNRLAQRYPGELRYVVWLARMELQQQILEPHFEKPGEDEVVLQRYAAELTQRLAQLDPTPPVAALEHLRGVLNDLTRNGRGNESPPYP